VDEDDGARRRWDEKLRSPPAHAAPLACRMDSEFSGRPLVHFAARELLLWRTKLDSDYSWTVVANFFHPIASCDAGLAKPYDCTAFGGP